MSMGGIHELANDPAVRAALARIPRVAPLPASTVHNYKSARFGRKAAKKVAPTPAPTPAMRPAPKMAARWRKPGYREATVRAMQRGHATRELIKAALNILDQRAAQGVADDAAYARLADTVAKLEALRV